MADQLAVSAGQFQVMPEASVFVRVLFLLWVSESFSLKKGSVRQTDFSSVARQFVRIPHADQKNDGVAHSFIHIGQIQSQNRYLFLGVALSR
jgi:hypothetical protein